MANNAFTRALDAINQECGWQEVETLVALCDDCAYTVHCDDRWVSGDDCGSHNGDTGECNGVWEHNPKEGDSGADCTVLAKHYGVSEEDVLAELQRPFDRGDMWYRVNGKNGHTIVFATVLPGVTMSHENRWTIVTTCFLSSDVADALVHAMWLAETPEENTHTPWCVGAWEVTGRFDPATDEPTTPGQEAILEVWANGGGSDACTMVGDVYTLGDLVGQGRGEVRFDLRRPLARLAFRYPCGGYEWPSATALACETPADLVEFGAELTRMF